MLLVILLVLLLCVCLTLAPAIGGGEDVGMDVAVRALFQ